jgi:hypothetical protein
LVLAVVTLEISIESTPLPPLPPPPSNDVIFAKFLHTPPPNICAPCAIMKPAEDMHASLHE